MSRWSSTPTLGVPWRWCGTAARLRRRGSSSHREEAGVEACESWSQTARALTALPSTPTSGTPRHVLDRFYVIWWFSAGLTQGCRDVQRREPPGVKPVFEPEVFRARFALLRRADTLTDADRFQQPLIPRLREEP